MKVDQFNQHLHSCRCCRHFTVGDEIIVDELCEFGDFLFKEVVNELTLLAQFLGDARGIVDGRGVSFSADAKL